MSDQENMLIATEFFDYDKHSVKAWTNKVLKGKSDSPVEIAKTLYLAVRDSIAYNPYVFSPDPNTFTASYVIENKESYCIPKAVLLGAAARYKGIPSRLGLGDVKNHLSSPRLIELLQSDIFRMHGYIELFLNGKWVKATPAFNSRLCQRMKVKPLEFDGINDSVFQEFSESGARAMEYINEHGTFSDVPYDFIMDGIQSAYPHLVQNRNNAQPFKGNLEHEV